MIQKKYPLIPFVLPFVSPWRTNARAGDNKRTNFCNTLLYKILEKKKKKLLHFKTRYGLMVLRLSELLNELFEKLNRLAGREIP